MCPSDVACPCALITSRKILLSHKFIFNKLLILIPIFKRTALSIVGLLSHFGSFSGATPLCIAAQSGRLAAVRCLANDLGADASRIDAEGRSPLFMAAYHGHLEVMQFLEVKPHLMGAQLMDMRQLENTSRSLHGLLRRRKSISH
jgi:predicted LPLAT superfamily acyltransferase